ncbi:MAG: hypothetical protein F6J94_13950 [Moorea sp. SIO1F2]|uniref:Uncharacterized protein n=1 Tax=Moorena bouillonii PNG TaxID=568701 RepID=A0A1U7NA08_9CYAN|nr:MULTISPECIES: hypothetical protein [unclassified Moorena]NEO00811.1 hypothetical protein [Moorena sp. SIO3I7]OLT62769.1 hypothetical protein BJP37_30795 [Moorena bouillonii PNG]NEO07351.1 hypothetical protein [Moorena sp. SIO3I8]NEO21622.1 hypothetical protein [Moorena sp. SIO4A5]NEP24112.1 hypothetical protein [Moorena sp. SIO3I6]
MGTYQLLPNMEIAIRVEEQQLLAQATGQEAFTLYPVSESDSSHTDSLSSVWASQPIQLLLRRRWALRTDCPAALFFWSFV